MDAELIEILNQFHTSLDESDANASGKMPEWATKMMKEASALLDILDPIADE